MSSSLTLIAFSAALAADGASTDLTLTLTGKKGAIPTDLKPTSPERGKYVVVANQNQTALSDLFAVLAVAPVPHLTVAAGSESWMQYVRDSITNLSEPDDNAPAPEPVVVEPVVVEPVDVAEPEPVVVKPSTSDAAHKPTAAMQRRLDAAKVKAAAKATKDAEREAKKALTAQPDPADGPKDFGPAFADGAEVKVSKVHRGEQAAWGTCEYGVTYDAADGGFTLASFSGERLDVAAGTKFKNANEMLIALVGKKRHHQTVARWFNLAPGGAKKERGPGRTKLDVTAPWPTSVPAGSVFAFEIRGDVVSGTSAAKFYAQVWRWLFQNGCASVESLPIRGSGSKRFIVAATPVHPSGDDFYRAEECVTGAFVEVNLSRTECYRRAKHFLAVSNVEYTVLIGEEQAAA